MPLTNNNFWVMYSIHTKPTFLENERTQQKHRSRALEYVKRWNNCIDIGSNVGMWTRELASKFKKVYCFEPNPNFLKELYVLSFPIISDIFAIPILLEYIIISSRLNMSCGS